MTDRFIKQKFDNDCGIAALAMLLNEPYTRVYRKMVSLGFKDGTDYALATKYLTSVGRELKAYLEVTSGKRDGILEVMKSSRGILIVPAKDFKKNHSYHALYWDGKRVFDPSPIRPYGKCGVKAKKVFVEYWHLMP